MDTNKGQVSKNMDTYGGASAEIMRLLVINPKLSFLIEKTGRNKSNVLKTLRNLIKKGKVKKIAPGVYQGVHVSGAIPPRCPCFRLHNLQIKLKVGDFNHKVVKSYFIKNKQFYNHRESATGDYVDFGGVTGLITSEDLYLYWPSDWDLKAKSFNELAPEIYDLVEETVRRWEEKFKLVLFKDGRVNFEICNGHVAFEQADVAKTLEISKIHSYILKDSQDGKARFIIDMSKGFVEVELVHPTKFLMDTEKVDYWAQSLINGTFKQAVEIAKQTPGQVEKLRAELWTEVKKTSEHQISQTQVMSQISDNLIYLTKEFIKLKHELGKG